MNRHSGKKGSPLRSQWWQKPSPLSAEEKATWIWGPAGFLPRSMMLSSPQQRLDGLYTSLLTQGYIMRSRMTRVQSQGEPAQPHFSDMATDGRRDGNSSG